MRVWLLPPFSMEHALAQLPSEAVIAAALNLGQNSLRCYITDGHLRSLIRLTGETGTAYRVGNADLLVRSRQLRSISGQGVRTIESIMVDAFCLCSSVGNPSNHCVEIFVRCPVLCRTDDGRCMSKFCELLWYTPRGFYWTMAERSEKDSIDGKDGD